jgi:hypothetical protein
MNQTTVVFGFDCDGPDVFDRTVEFAIENKILTATFHVLTPLPGTRAFDRLDAEGRLLHRNWACYDADHVVFRPRRMSVEQLEAGRRHAYREFLTCGSILRRSFGLPGVLKRIVYNVAWAKVDPLWVAIQRLGLMPFARQIFERVLRLNTATPGRRHAEARNRDPELSLNAPGPMEQGQSVGVPYADDLRPELVQIHAGSD